jgi:hypothetical protein
MGLYFIFILWGITLALIFTSVIAIRLGKGAISGALAVICIILVFPFGIASIQIAYDMIKGSIEASQHAKLDAHKHKNSTEQGAAANP